MTLHSVGNNIRNALYLAERKLAGMLLPVGLSLHSSNEALNVSVSTTGMKVSENWITGLFTTSK